ncbi:DUF3958 family protein [Listeria booriae]|uniref:DUF3958 family protein n=1 Tax=Listeria booriae TaxID=1552123 RepID=UPI001625B18B|nr:DUF3958 family protein [Listeria booriae]MBC1804255.1 DUF3958 family protein [Listeria booriae]MBC2022647.1 DUF3958 family protein [Listeria booriae]
MRQHEEAIRKAREKQRDLEDITLAFRQLQREQAELLTRVGNAWRGNQADYKLGAIGEDIAHEQRVMQKRLHQLEEQLQAEYKQVQADVERAKEAKADATH